ncbi:MAG: YfcE family phosphodiesterase, partial [Acidobacteriota bacterium]|nr:YfcE family phosphodiesterase [Acidobacteriota bacterium]
MHPRVHHVGIVAATTRRALPALRQRLEGVEVILHAGGLGPADVIEALGALAPLRAVVDQQDYLLWGDRFPEIDTLTVGPARILLTHLAGRPPEW